jgi:hypothetical protein
MSTKVENMRKFGELIGMAFKLKMICLIIQRKLSGNQLVMIGTENDLTVNPCFKPVLKNHG